MEEPEEVITQDEVAHRTLSKETKVISCLPDQPRHKIAPWKQPLKMDDPPGGETFKTYKNPLIDQNDIGRHL